MPCILKYIFWESINLMYKKISAFVGIGFIILIAIVIFVGLPWMILGFSKNPPDPLQIKGEFPYKIVYTIYGQKYTKEGTFICEYEGISVNEGVGKYRKWKGYVSGTDKPYVVLYTSGNTEILCNIGEPEYYMNDTEHPNYIKVVKPYLFSSIIGMPESVIKSQYKIEILEWTLSEPINNSFN